MQTIFNDYTKRYFFVYSGIQNATSDLFCNNELETLNSNETIHRHLKKVGYKRIIFYDAGREYYYDYETPRLIKNKKEQITVDSSSKKQRIISGPLGRKRIRTNNNHTNPSNESTNLNNKLKKNLQISESISHFDNMLSDASIKTAIIFPNIFNFIQSLNVDRSLLSLFDQKMVDWNNRLDVENKNILIFMDAYGLSIDEIKDRVNNLGYNFLTSKIFISTVEDDITLPNNVKLLFSPNKDEVENLVNYYKLSKGLSVDWSEFDECVDEVVKYIKQNSIPLKDVVALFERLDIFNKDRIYKVFNLSIEKRGFELLKEMSGVEYIQEDIKKMVKVINREKSKVNYRKVVYEDVQRLLSHKENSFRTNLNITLVGNPGTGKTTIAKIVADIFKDEGIVEYGQLIKVTRADLVSEHIGGTALKTKGVIDQAIGGVLFIDEAYTLSQGGDGDFGQEAIDMLVEAMTDRKGEFSVIIAGYPDDIENLLLTNAGLKRRFKHKILLKDYEPKILKEIFIRLVQKAEYSISAELDEKLLGFLTNWFNARDERTFGNAGELEEQIFEKMIENLKDNENELKLLHIPKELQKFIKQKSITDATKELDKLIGLQLAKNNISSIINSMKISRLRDEGVTSGHYIFQGNPGTGKTTLARILGELFKDLKLLSKGHFLEVTREDLVASYVGQTAQKTKEVLEKALGGVLFIDEAYTLSSGGEGDFGQEAINTIVPFMENNRDKFTLIIAGYSNDITNFLNKNEGLKSRFNHTITFEDYSADEMYQIFKIFSKGYSYTNSVEIQIKNKLNEIVLNKTDSFGNGREARNFFNYLKTNQNNRLVKIENLKQRDSRLYEFLLEDLS